MTSVCKKEVGDVNLIHSVSIISDNIGCMRVIAGVYFSIRGGGTLATQDWHAEMMGTYYIYSKE